MHLPKRRLAHAGRAEYFGDLPAHVPAGHGSAWEPFGREDSVELREAGRDDTGALAQERLEGLRGGDGRQSVYSQVSQMKGNAGGAGLTYATMGRVRMRTWECRCPS